MLYGLAEMLLWTASVECTDHSIGLHLDSVTHSPSEINQTCASTVCSAGFHFCYHDLAEMSFSGFDATLPKDRPPARQARGIFENPDPFADVARATPQGLHDDDDDA